jgi:AbrB family looped-hinge helix DNA binding protein
LENSNKESDIKCDQFHHERMRNHHGRMRKHSDRVIVKGYMRPDGTSYYVVIPKQVREKFDLKGGEYFLIKAKPLKNEITLKIAKMFEEEQE